MSTDRGNGKDSAAKRALIAVQTLRTKLDAVQRAQKEPIAVVGMGCRFPGGAESLDAYWQLLRDGVDGIVEIPPDRWDVDDYYHTDEAKAGKMNTRWGGFLRSSIREFDADFFGISRLEAEHMDPQQRLLLEVAWETLEHAGEAPEGVAGSRTGVFVGVTSHSDEYWQRFIDPARIGAFSGTGTSHSVISGRLSYFFDFHGPSVAVDTACSSSLVAVHQACMSLRAGECDAALAGGVNLILEPHFTIAMSRIGLMASDGRCKTFDHRADGYVRGEGCGLVMLRRLSDALERGDRILATIRGSAVVQDGKTNGLSAPNGLSQQKVLRAALEQAELSAEDVGYIEAHGTGTALGDPIEIEALDAVYGEGCGSGRRCTVGAVKSNVGHLEGAAGIAGLIKAVLVLDRAVIPKNLHFEELNPHIELDHSPLDLATSTEPWPRTRAPRHVGVSSFGWSGTNAHVVLGEAPETAPRPDARDRPALLCLSAASPAALTIAAERLGDFLAGESGEESAASAPELRDVAHTLTRGRAVFPHRLALAAETPAEAAAELRAFVEHGRPGRSSAVGPRESGATGEEPVVFVFSGQGSQWAGMAADLYEQQPIFREALDRVDAALVAEGVTSPKAAIAEDEASGRMQRTDVAQPTIFAVQVALAELYASLGVKPAAVVGHSVGEIAAALVAGALDLKGAARVVRHRSRLMQSRTGLGRMALVAVGADRVAEVLAELDTFAGRVVAAAFNAPDATVLAGDEEALEAALARFAELGVEAKSLRVDYAFHSPQMDPVLDELETSLAGLQSREPVVPMVSTVTAAPVAEGELGAGYWRRNVRLPVRFADALERLLADGRRTFLEVGPHPVLSMGMGDQLRERGEKGVVAGSLRRGEPGLRSLWIGLAALWTAGVPVDRHAVNGTGGRTVDLPTYPWQRSTHWLERPALGFGASASSTAGLLAPPADHPLLGVHVEVAADRPTHIFEAQLRLDDLPWLRDHRVRGTVVMPGAALAEMLAASARRAFGESCRLRDMRFEHPLILAEAGRAVQVAWVSEVSGHATGRIISRPSGSAAGANAVVHARAGVSFAGEVPAPEPSERLRTEGMVELEVDRLYGDLEDRGLAYGPAFRGVRSLFRASAEADEGPVPVCAEVSLPPSVTADAEGRGVEDGGAEAYGVHPVLLDAAFQAVTAALPESAGTPVPVGCRSYRIHAPAGPSTGVIVRRSEKVSSVAAGEEPLDVILVDAEGRPVAELLGLELARLADDAVADSNWHMTFEPAPLPELEGEAETALEGSWVIVAGADTNTVSAGEAEALARDLRAAGAEVDVLPGLADRDTLHGVSGVVDLRALDLVSLDPEAFDPEALDRALVDALELIRLCTAEDGNRPARRLGVTLGAGARGVVRPASAPFWGLDRVARSEYPGVALRSVDLDPESTPEQWRQQLVRECAAVESADEVVWRGGERFVPRLAHGVGAAELGGSIQAPSPADPAADEPLHADRDTFRLEVHRPGTVDGAVFRGVPTEEPGPGQAAVQIAASALNFSDVLKVMGTYPGLPEGPVPLGLEAVGRVTAVGEGVEHLTPGRDCLLLAPGALASRIVVDARLAVPMPTGFSVEEAAGLPVAYATAWYGLCDLARLQAGERVLIHSASGGVGLAAVRLAQSLGAEVIATAGTEEKRELLRSRGVEHVFDSRSLDFVDGVRALDGVPGVDVVLNSLVGEALTASLELLRSSGRFVEIGKRDIYDAGRLNLGLFQMNLSFFAVDLDAFLRSHPERIGRIWAGLEPLFGTGTVMPLPTMAYDLGTVDEALREMARGRHIGKFIIRVSGQEARGSRPAEVRSENAGPRDAERLRGTWLVTGGLGALGLEVAGRLAELGAERLVLAGRRGRDAVRGSVAAILDDLCASGVDVDVTALDVADESAVSTLVGRLVNADVPLRGIVHAAGVLEDGLLTGLDADAVRRVTAPKIRGTWNLHRATVEHGASLHNFVLFSSAAALLGSPGQGNYAAANAFLPAVALHRRAAGLPAVSLDWGPWAEVGMAADEARGGLLARRGLRGLRTSEALDALSSHLLCPGAPSAAVLALDPEAWAASYPAAGRGLLAGWVASGEAAGDSAANRGPITGETPEERRHELLDYLCVQVSRVMGTDGVEVNPSAPLGDYGLGSLQSTELRNALEGDLGVSLPSTLIWRFPTVADLAAEVAEQMGLDIAGESPPETVPSAETSGEDSIEVSETEDLGDLLDQELVSLETLMG